MHLPPFQRLLDDLGPQLLRFLVSMVGPNDAEDCFQETTLSALSAYTRLRHSDDLRAWMFTIARRKAIDVLRARARAPIPSQQVPERAQSAEWAVPDVEDSDGDLWARVRALPERQRSAVGLRYVADLSYADVARVMGCSPEAARQSVSVGLRHLRKEMS